VPPCRTCRDRLTQRRKDAKGKQNVIGKEVGIGESPNSVDLWLNKRSCIGGSVILRLPRLLIALALASSIGLQWGVLQTMAWVGMVVTYSQQSSFSEALAKTFDGNHPCKLCKRVAQGRQSGKPVGLQPDGKKFEFSYTCLVFIFKAPTRFWEIRSLPIEAERLAEAPLVPPPKTLLG